MNGEQGISVVNITKTGSVGGKDHYEVNLSDGSTTPNGFDVYNGKDGVSISNVSLASTVGNVKNYNVNLSDGTITPNGFSVADGISSYVHVRYSASFDGQNMVAVPTDSTVYIGICVTTQNTAPTDASVYSWVRFIGKSGSGSGDMLKADYSTIYEGVVDRAVSLYDGASEISGAQLMTKANYAGKGVIGAVDKATELIDTENGRTANTQVLSNLSESESGQLLYDNRPIEGDAISDKTLEEFNQMDIEDKKGKYFAITNDDQRIVVDDRLLPNSNNPIRNKVVTPYCVKVGEEDITGVAPTLSASVVQLNNTLANSLKVTRGSGTLPSTYTSISSSTLGISDLTSIVGYEMFVKSNNIWYTLARSEAFMKVGGANIYIYNDVAENVGREFIINIAYSPQLTS